MLTRSAAGNAKVLKEQYTLLKDALNDYYDGVEAKAIDVAVRIRVLVHETDKSHAFLATIDPNYRALDIYHKRAPGPKTLFSMMQRIQMSGDGTSKIIRDDFQLGFHELVSLERWWTEPYLKIGPVHSSKGQVVLDVTNKDGGAHVDPEGVPTRHATATEPPFQFGGNPNFVRPNLARSTVAQAGNELRDYLERHFPTLIV
jgi:hypothetical protein